MDQALFRKTWNVCLKDSTGLTNPVLVILAGKGWDYISHEHWRVPLMEIYFINPPNLTGAVLSGNVESSAGTPTPERMLGIGSSVQSAPCLC